MDVRHQDRARAVGVDEVQHLVDAAPVGVAAEHGAGAVVLEDLAVAVGEVERGGAVDGLRLPPAARIVRVARGVAGAARTHQPVLGVVGVGEGAVAGEIAVAVVAGRRGTHGGVLVEGVGAVGDARR